MPADHEPGPGGSPPAEADEADEATELTVPDDLADRGFVPL